MPVPHQKKRHSSQQQPPKGWRGSSIVELIAVVAITVALTLIAIPIYNDYIDKAKVTVALDTMSTIRKSLQSFHEEHQEYPAGSLNFFSTGKDSKERNVFASIILEKISEDISPVSYKATVDSYTFIAKAKDSEQTSMTLTPHKLSH